MPKEVDRVTSPTASAILDIAERLVQNRGFNGFSYADIASELGITKASLHYHFPGKAELGESLIRRYSARFGDALVEIGGRKTPALEKLSAYCDLYRVVLRSERMCLCGMLAAEYETLPTAMRDAVVVFFDENQGWLANLLADGRATDDLHFTGSPDEAAHEIIAALEGAMLVSRPYQNTAVLDSVAKRVVLEFSAADEAGADR
jgi:TetR/AcrR family transcriptional regulator, transcriptional repressor for nem operon